MFDSNSLLEMKNLLSTKKCFGKTIGKEKDKKRFPVVNFGKQFSDSI